MHNPSEKKRSIHMICLSIPWPPDYGGAIDMWYKIQAFRRAEIPVILHCFEYDRPQSPVLEKYCENVYYYPRQRRVRDLLSIVPFIVKSRKNSRLVKNLLQDNSPILIEGIHSSWLAQHPLLKNREVWLRLHNIESDYYKNLARLETKWSKKLFFFTESLKLKRYEKTHINVSGVFCISENDYSFFKNIYKNCHLIPPFHGHNKVQSTPGKGNFLLYHGNLALAENQRNALFLAHLSSRFPLPLIIAGKSAPARFINKLKPFNGVQLQTDLPQEAMDNLLREASIILLPAIQTTGFRLKLLSSLYKGRHVIADPRLVVDTGLAPLVHLARTKDEWFDIINHLSNKPLDTQDIKLRQRLLNPFSDNNNAKKMISMIFSEPVSVE